MIRVYNYMASAVALTGVVAYLTFTMSVVTNSAGAVDRGLTPLGHVPVQRPVHVGADAGAAGVGVLPQLRDQLARCRDGALLFFVYAALLGVSLATIFIVYTATSIARVFFISAAAFGALSLYGYTTKRDLSAMGAFMIMGLIGLIIASLVNLFLKSSGLDFASRSIGVLVFAGLTAWDTQKIKEHV